MDFTTIILVAVVLLILTFFTYNRLFASWDYWTSRGIPSVPGAVPFFGNTFSVFRLRENFSTYCKHVYDSYPNKSMVGFYNFKNPVLMLRDVELVKTVTQTKFNYFQHNEAELDIENDPLIGRDPFFVRGQAWRDSRATFVSTLSLKRIKIMTTIAVNVCEKLKDYLSKKNVNKDCLELEAKLLFSRYTTEVAAATVLGIEGNSFADDYRGTLLEGMKATMDPSKITAVKHNIALFLPGLCKYLNIRWVPVEVDKRYRDIVKQVEDMRQKDSTGGDDVLRLLLDMEKDGKIPRVEVLGHGFSFFLESYETSSLTLSFVCYFMAKHQNIQNRLRSEIVAVLGKHEGQLTYEAINEMTYLEQIINETMRLFPAVGVLSKVCAEAYRLEGPDGLAVNVEPGTTILIPTLGLQMDPEFWDNPEEFNPDRFEKSNNDGIRKYVHLPFGEGPRACPGQRLGIIQVKAAIATVVKNYRIESSKKMAEPLRVDPRYFMSTAVGGFWIKLRPLEK